MESPETVLGMDLMRNPVELTVANMRWRPGAYGIILNEKQQVLVLDNIHTNLYDVPGGGVEIWETIPDALRREIWEETGLSAEIGDLLTVVDYFFHAPSGRQMHSILIYFQAFAISGELRSSLMEDEWSVNPHWVDLESLTEEQGRVWWPALQLALERRG